jgi:ABC-type multidrug transport system fused ATPase/permease subunit
MRVWQPGGHLTMQRGADVRDWSWQATIRRIRFLARYTKRYRLRTTLAIVSLLLATATFLIPPFLTRYAIDDGVRQGDLRLLTITVALMIAAGLASLVTGALQTYFTGWTGERILADLRNDLFRSL